LHNPDNTHSHFDNLYAFPEGMLGKIKIGASIDQPSKKSETEKKYVELRPKLVLASDVKKKPVSWLWKNKIPRGMLSIITGLAGVTKTFWTVYLTSRITTGRDWADGSPCELGSVLFFSGEEGIADVYKERFEGNGVDQTNVVFWDGMVNENNERSDVDVSLKMIAEVRLTYVA
jgi:hypothetical protein